MSEPSLQTGAAQPPPDRPPAPPGRPPGPPLGAGRIVQAFRPPLRFAQVRTAGFYDDAGFCQDCDAPYCYQHWRVSDTGYGYCPHGHARTWTRTSRR